jgi:hypothetical protein
MLTELPGPERQAAEELEQWKTHHEERKVIDASPAAISLAMICTREQLCVRQKAVVFGISNLRVRGVRRYGMLQG